MRRATGTDLIGVVVSLGVWIMCIYLQRILPLPVMHLKAGWRWGVGLLFLADGLVTMLWSAAILSKAHRESQLATSGPYALVRHPIYGAILWDSTAAVAFLFQSWLVLIGVVPLHLAWIRLVRPEEQELFDRFGDAYMHYSAETGQFLPRLKSLIGITKSPEDPSG